MSVWLDIIGVSEAGLSALSPAHAKLVERAEIIVGSQRFIDQCPSNHQTRIVWRSGVEKMVEQVREQRGRPTVILATGDPGWFGIGATLAKNFDGDEFRIHPSPSAFQLAAARMGWPLQDCATLSLHGRVVENLHPHLVPGNRILALTSNAGTCDQVTEILRARAYGSSTLTVLENLGGAETIFSFVAKDGPPEPIGDFYTLAIACVADKDAQILPSVPGLPDDAFVHDGQLTKRDVRAATLAKLAPYPEALLWDVGAGCGSIAIEWMRAARGARAICFERSEDRCHLIAQNRGALGVPDLKIASGDAPDILLGREAPDAIFIGGAVSDDRVFDVCWQALRSGGRLVANAVTLEGQEALHRRQEEFGGELTRLEISKLDRVGGRRVMRPAMAVTQWAVTRGGGE